MLEISIERVLLNHNVDIIVKSFHGIELGTSRRIADVFFIRNMYYLQKNVNLLFFYR